MKRLARTPLSILDLAPYPQGQSIADAYRHTRDLAQHAEQWGYKRYWIAEHHNIEGIASAATSILIGHVADHTKSIRVGSGGIMLPNHPPFVIAEQFGTLATLYPGRIDLGLGRAPGSDRLTMHAMRRGSGGRETDFGELIEELLFYLAKPEPDQKLKAIPGAGADVQIWILGSSLYSARLAARLGFPYSFAGHFAPQVMLEAFDLYRREFRPSEVLAEPYVMVGVPVVAAKTDEEAQRLATTSYQTFLNLVRRKPTQAPPPADSMEGLWTYEEEMAVHSMMELLIVGGPETVQRGLQTLIDATQADELIIASNFYHHSDRLKSYEILAELAKASPSAVAAQVHN